MYIKINNYNISSVCVPLVYKEIESIVYNIVGWNKKYVMNIV